MSQTRCKEVFYFDELSEQAKEQARVWYRQGFDYDWWDNVYDTIQDAARYLGLTFSTRAVPLMNGKTSHEPEIYFSGFYHQGSGSSFAGTWRAKDTDADKLKADFHTDKDLHAIADKLAALAYENPGLSASISTRGDNWITVEVDDGEERNELLDTFPYDSPEYRACAAEDRAREDRLEETLRDFNRWIYTSLRDEYEYLTADEQVDESIRANEYEFTEDGKRYHY